MKASDYKCPSCSAPLKFNPETGSWRCEYCAIDYSLEELEENEKEFEDLDSKETIEVDEYTCPNCGAKIIADENTTATFCVYCGNTSIIKNRLTGELKPSKVIPFNTTKEQAISAFLKSKNGKPFAPRKFGKKEQVEKITGVYIPFWLYDVDADAELAGQGKEIDSWRSGDYIYEETKIYLVERNGELSFTKIPVDGSEKFVDDVMDSIEPFDYTEMKEFTPAYLSGFLAEKYDVNKENAYLRAQERVNNSMRTYLKNDISGYDEFEETNFIINKNLKKIEYVLLPVWMLNVKYKGKMHMFAMNGQTGKMVGDIPISWIKFSLWLISLFLVFSIIGLTIMEYVS